MGIARNGQNLPEMSHSIPLADCQARCISEISGPECYRQFQNMGFHYGSSFQTIERLWIGNKEALGHIHIPAHITPHFPDYQLHPVVLDACFQMLLAISAMAGGKERDQMGMYLPVGVECIRVYGLPIMDMWCHAELVKQEASFLEGRIVLCDEGGNILVDIQGFRVQSLDNAASLFSPTLTRPDTWLYDLQWQPAQNIREEQAEAFAGTGDTGCWLIFADESGVGVRLADLLEAQGQTRVLVFPGEAYCQLDAGRYVIGPASLEDYQRLLSGALDSTHFQWRGVVHLWSLNAHCTVESDVDSLQAMQDISTYSALYLVQAMAKSDTLSRLWLVTQGAQSVEPGEALPEIAQSPLWGLGRVVYEEYIAMRGALVDLDPTGVSDNAAMLAEELRQSDAEHQIAIRHNLRYVPRLEHMRTSPQRLLPSFRSDASYLITGGLGALGILVARWMIQRGARHLILAGRSTLPPRTAWQSIPEGHPQAMQIAHVRELEALGATVHLAALDIADERSLAAYLENYQREGWPNIRGVIHAAGVVQDQILWNMDKETFNKVLRPKMLGSWSLHRCVQHIPLDFFILFSSVAALIVAPGQSNYAAGNAFVDAMVSFRRFHGQPALSINWGPWAAGMITRLNLGEFYAQRGVECIPAETGLQLLDHIFANDRAQVLVASVHWPTLLDAYPIIPRMIYHLGRQVNEGTDTAPGNETEGILQKLRAADTTERVTLVVSHLAGIVARSLRIEQARLDVEAPLNALGMDSMIAIELKNRIEQRMGINISVVDLLQGATVSQLATQVLQQLMAGILAHPQEGEFAEVEDLDILREQVDEDILAQLLQQIEQLSSDQAKALLVPGRTTE